MEKLRRLSVVVHRHLHAMDSEVLTKLWVCHYVTELTGICESSLQETRYRCRHVSQRRQKDKQILRPRPSNARVAVLLLIDGRRYSLCCRLAVVAYRARPRPGVLASHMSQSGATQWSTRRAETALRRSVCLLSYVREEERFTPVSLRSLRARLPKLVRLRLHFIFRLPS